MEGLSTLEYIWTKLGETIANSSQLGFVKIGNNINVEKSGNISVGSSSDIDMGSDYVISWGDSYTNISKDKVTKAVWNDYADVIDVPSDLEVIPGKCYCYSNNEYRESKVYLDSLCLGICSDTAGFFTGGSSNKNHLPIAISGFTLAFVDKEYPAGTPLVCTESGYLTKIDGADLPFHSHEIIAHYWKPELNSTWGPEDKPVQVNNRHWVKIR